MIVYGRRLKLLIPLLIVSVLLPLGSLLMWQQYQTMIERLQSQHMISFRQQALKLQEDVERYYRQQLPAEVEREILVMMSDSHIQYVLLTDAENRIIYATQFRWKGRLLDELKVFQGVASFKQVSAVAFTEDQQQHVMRGHLPVVLKKSSSQQLRNAEKGMLYIAYSDADDVAFLQRQLDQQLLYFIIGICILIGILIAVLRLWVNQPIETLNHFVAQIKAGDNHPANIEIHGKGELSSLANALNVMNEKIYHASHFIRHSNAILAKIVKDTSLEGTLESIVHMYEADTPGLRASILLKRGNRLLHGAAPSLPDAYCQAIDGVEIGPNVGSCGTSAYLGKRVIVSDIANDPFWQQYKALALPHQLCAC